MLFYGTEFLSEICNTIFSHTSAYKIDWSLCLLADGKIDPTSLPMLDKRCYIRGNLHATFDVMTFQSFGQGPFSTFATLACSTAIQKRLQKRFQKSVDFLFVNKNIKCWYAKIV